MPRTTATAPILARRGINDIVNLFMENEQYDYEGYCDTIESHEAFYRAQTIAALPPATAISELTGIDYEDFSAPFTQDITGTKRGIGFSASREVIMRDFYQVIEKRGTALARSIKQAMDADFANFFNLGTTTATVSADGVALFSASHLANSGFTSTIVSGNPALSAAGLEAGIAALQSANDYMGQPMYIDGPYTLVVPTGLRGLANRLVRAQQYPTTPNNDPNWAGDYVSRIVTLRRATFTAGWALIANGGNMANPLKVLSASDMWIDTQYDIDKQAWKYTAAKIWKKFNTAPYGFVWSSGANA